ncbi:hypothetical protein [Paracidovorax konjaci]|uniref:Uncharacterized protein n=1 Tax=Paracidovorax konjaci TaxID=32040 RepID=A0A1I1XQK8_9BURK|nr:hypothetical protein [Paracidovorax konjaci]SFE09574.1 hypothetical protein SAMN04489710_11456 [Paracidovorax konjaci]
MSTAACRPIRHALPAANGQPLRLTNGEAFALRALCLAAEDPEISERLDCIAAAVAREWAGHATASEMAELAGVWPRLLEFIESSGWRLPA